MLTEAMKKGKVISSLAITPGTAFMAEIQDSLAYYICQRLMNKKFAHLHYELSGSTVQVFCCENWRLAEIQDQ